MKLAQSFTQSRLKEDLRKKTQISLIKMEVSRNHEDIRFCEEDSTSLDSQDVPMIIGKRGCTVQPELTRQTSFIRVIRRISSSHSPVYTWKVGCLVATAIIVMLAVLIVVLGTYLLLNTNKLDSTMEELYKLQSEMECLQSQAGEETVFIKCPQASIDSQCPVKCARVC